MFQGEIVLFAEDSHGKRNKSSNKVAGLRLRQFWLRGEPHNMQVAVEKGRCSELAARTRLLLYRLTICINVRCGQGSFNLRIQEFLQSPTCPKRHAQLCC